MSFWQKIFGPKGLPPRDHGPAAEAPGDVTSDNRKRGLWVESDVYDWQLVEVIYHDGVRQGPYRMWDRKEGWLRERGTMVDDKKHGVVEMFGKTGKRLNRAEMVAGKTHGMFRVFADDGSIKIEREYRDGELWHGTQDHFHEGVRYSHKRVEHGKRVGTWEDNDYMGRPRKRETFVDGKRHGVYTEHHEGGAVRLEGEYRDDKRTGTWRWLNPKGIAIATIDYDGDAVWRAGTLALEPTDDADLARWIELADAWTNLGMPEGYWFYVENAIDKWPDGDRDRALAWLTARIAESGPRRTTLGRGWIAHLVDAVDDPRGMLVDGIALDNHAWNPEQVARVVRRAGVLRELSLYECHIEPTVDALFPDGVAWPNLEDLAIEECGELGQIIPRLCAATWTTKLRELRLDDNDDGISIENCARIGAAPFWATLETIALQNVGDLDGLVAAIGKRDTPALREIELKTYGATLHAESLMDLADPARHPQLASVEIEGVVHGTWKRAVREIRKNRPQLELRLSRES